MVSVAIIGTGFGAKVHKPGWEKIPGVRVAANIGNDKTNIERAITNPDNDIVSIAVPPYAQASIALMALKHSKAILLEKPAGLNLRETKKIAALAQIKSAVAAVDFEFRFVPHFQFLKDLLDKKAIGDISAITIGWVTGGRAGNTALNWSNYTKYGGGVLLNYGTHVADYIQWLFGDITHVLGKLDIVKKPGANKSRPDAEDTVAILGTLKNKVPLSIFISNVLHNGCGHNIEIFGSTGTLVLRNPNVFDAVKGFNLYKTNPESKLVQLKIPARYGKIYHGPADGRIMPFQKLAAGLVTALKTKKTGAVPTINDAVKAQKVVSAVLKSNHSHRWEKV